MMTAEMVQLSDGLIFKKGISTVSFALFGTLLLRRCVSVEGVYERTLHYAPVPERMKQLGESFIQHRTLAQNMLRINRKGGGVLGGVSMVSGVSIEAIYNHFAVHALNLPRSIRPALVEAELKAEQELCFINPDILGLYQEARRLGRRVGIVAESHWSPEQVRTLLRAVAPDLVFDFVYTSAQPEAVEAGGLFKLFRASEGLKPSKAVHIGIDEDTVEQQMAGIALIPYELPADPWGGHSKREEAAARLLAMSDRGFNWRLDGGLRLMRRLALAKVQPASPHHAVGAAVLGPVMAGFQRHIERRLAELAGPGRRIKVLFLARDGYLPMRMWSASGAGRAEYVEINRRIAMIAGAEGEGGLETVQGLIASMPFVSASGVEDFFKIKLPAKVKAFFAEQEDNVSPGDKFAAAIPRLMGRKTLKKLSENLRAALLDYLRVKIDDLESCTDMVLVDIGYTGNIQKGLRRVFNVEGRKIRLHGIYLMPHGESFVELPDEDTVSGYLDDTVMSPGAKRALMRDAPLIEEFCCAPVGSARSYDKGREVREVDVRLPQEISFCLEMQDECVRYFDAYRDVVKRFGVDPMEDFETYRVWTAAILSRFVMMPNGLECQTFGPLLHDVSLGSRALIATITTADIKNLMGTLPFPAVCSIHHPPVWLGGSLAAYSAAAGFCYAATGFGLGTDDFFGDVEVGAFEATIIKEERAVPIPVPASLTPFGDLRLRIPVLNKDGDSVVALPLKGPLSRGVVRSLILQGGADITEATTTRYGEPQPIETLQALGAMLDGTFFHAVQPEAYLLLSIPAFKQTVSVLTVLITPLFDN
ncbi:hypothetical protein [Telmatospirillum siberiense]|uniref:Uncharacterized protein n=1 Tax=Telmatospirillum siberiense TaxID=382514 RepID=A0A2N3Q011_9PROT|nr:hypothetical protein [Telmatospirillum siberiense]PKU25993.1 hypothetical protein CWS72_02285 [Telmatospirillum siberiense]